ncbi:restriction endonuclease subunit S [Sinorhizobium fredii]|uniref:restriction endonuclease subunit S n=1 Tax=Rhizobium fredii TaxID=380 RepID=UPI0004B93E85|nr:restriction endonuclease subunit S [Sinorhizobium fredii]
MITLQERVHGVAPPAAWNLAKLHRILRVRKGMKNIGMQEKNLLSLSYGRIIRKNIDSAEGLLPESFETYQIVEPGNIVMRLTDLQNDKRSLRQGLVNERGIITSAYDALELVENHDPRFWAYFLLALDLTKYYYSLGAGVRQSIKFSDFPNDWLAVPDIITQNTIADFLDRETARIDRLIEKKKQLLDVLVDARSTTISAAVTVGIDPNAELISTTSVYLPTVPSGWTVWRLKHLAQVNGGLTLGRTVKPGSPVTPTPYLRVANVQAGWLDLSDVAEIDATESEIKRYSLRDGDVLMNEGGDNDKLGRGAVWRAAFSPCLNQNHVFAVRPHNLGYSDWISLATNARYARDFFFLHSNQSTNLASISKTNLQKFPVAIPPMEVMQDILSRVSLRIERITIISAKIQASIERLRDQRTAIITAAVTGQIDVTAWPMRGQTDRQLDDLQKAMRA